MKTKHDRKLKEIYDILDAVDDDLYELRENLEQKLDFRYHGVGNKDVKSMRDDEIEEILDSSIYDTDELEEDLDILEELIYHIEDALSLISVDIEQIKRRTVKINRRIEELQSKNKN